MERFILVNILVEDFFGVAVFEDALFDEVELGAAFSVPVT